MAEKKRELTAGERQLVIDSLPAGIEKILDEVRLSDGAGKNPIPAIAFMNKANHALTFGRTIYFGQQFSDDFSTGGDGGKGLLLHEMTHVWQYARHGVPGFLARYTRDFVSARFNAGRMYEYKSRAPFGPARLEAQAQMVQDYFLARAAQATAKANDLAESLAGSRMYGL
jgi:hypothetical protein